MPLIDRLRLATAPLHAQVEQTFEDCFDLRTVEGYVAVLKAFYGFVLPWEQAVHGCGDPEIQMLMSSRWRADRLAADLRHFHHGPDDMPKCSELPALDGGRLLGSVYVMEGSTLGGLKISKTLEASLGLTTGLGRSYFLGEGARALSRWRDFLVEFDRLGGVRCEAEIVAGASNTFVTLASWLKRQGTRLIIGRGA
ncbi:biliverdin-producing heme oxygenase [Humisphaera borealis]|uniref:Biliverdin-producing heme oxygenase n=1 Tax=Humisphaera borealis TaxID=2807512 RepID=A0A7M2WZ12_9BACT|nr:biliverdin-producing heme oxygenase [Humisphaera borealis]QOV90715.1 biliverdin-producing heme oxygenase [Humisphaera borealis]